MASIVPVNYELRFEPLFHNFTFNSTEIITLNLPNPTNSIMLDSAELTIKKCHVVQGTKTISAEPFLNAKNERLTIKLAKKIKGKAKLCIEFTGILKRQAFRILQKSVQGQKRKDKVSRNNTVRGCRC